MADLTTDFADLERDTRVQGSDGRYTTLISPHWVVWSPQGGYLMALPLRAAGAASEFAKPLSLACHFLSAPKLGPAELVVTSLRRTRIAESLRVSCEQDGRLFLEAMVWTGDTVPGLDHAATGMPEVPGHDTLAPVPLPAAGPATGFHTLWPNLEIRPCGPPSRAWTEPGEPRQRDWIRFRNFPKTADAFAEAGRYAMGLDTSPGRPRPTPTLVTHASSRPHCPSRSTSIEAPTASGCSRMPTHPAPATEGSSCTSACGAPQATSSPAAPARRSAAPARPERERSARGWNVPRAAGGIARASLYSRGTAKRIKRSTRAARMRSMSSRLTRADVGV
jgi:hypothetical protein